MKRIAILTLTSLVLPIHTFAFSYSTEILHRDSLSDALPKLYVQAILDQVCVPLPSQCLTALNASAKENRDYTHTPIKYSVGGNNRLVASSNIVLRKIDINWRSLNKTYSNNFTTVLKRVLDQLGSYKYQKHYLSRLQEKVSNK